MNHKILLRVLGLMLTLVYHTTRAEMHVSLSKSRTTQLKREFYQLLDAYNEQLSPSNLQRAQEIINTLELDRSKLRSAQLLRAELERVTGKKSTPQKIETAQPKAADIHALNTAIDTQELPATTNNHFDMPLSLEEQLMNSGNENVAMQPDIAPLVAYLEQPHGSPSIPLPVQQPAPTVNNLQNILQQELDTTSNAIVQTQKNLQQHQAMNDVLKSVQQLSKETERNMQIAQQSTRLTNQQMEALKKEFSTLQMSVSSSQNQFNMLKNSLEKKLQDQIAALIDLDQQKKMMVTGLHAELAETNETVDLANSRITQLRKDLMTHQEQHVSSITAAQQEQQKTVAQLEKELTSMRTNLDLLCQNTQSYKEQQEQRLAKHEASLTQQEKNLAAQEHNKETIAALQKEFAATCASLDAMQQQLAAYKELEKVAAHKHEVAAVQKSVQELSQEMRHQQEITRLVQMQVHRPAQQEVAAAENSPADDMVQELQEEIAALKVAMMQLQTPVAVAHHAGNTSLQEQINVPCEQPAISHVCHDALDDMIEQIRSELSNQKNQAPIRLLSAR